MSQKMLKGNKITILYLQRVNETFKKTMGRRERRMTKEILW